MRPCKASRSTATARTGRICCCPPATRRPARLRRLPMTKLRIIGEIKRASPSKGLINDFKSPVEVALKFREGEVDALSVLTDEPFFQGRLDYLDALKRIGLPLLRKDFIIDEY